MRRVAGLAWDHPLAAAILLAGLLAIAALGATRLRIDFSSTSFYASDDAAAVALGTFQDRWGPDDNVVVVVVQAVAGDLLTQPRVEAIGRLAQALAGIDGVGRTQSIATIRVAPPDEPLEAARPIWELPAFDAPGPVTRAEVLAGLPFVPLLLSTDARAAAILVELAVPADDPAALLPVVDRIEAVVAAADTPDLTLGLAGVPAVRASFVRLTVRDQLRLVPASLGVIALALFWIFRRAHGVLLPGAAALVPLALLLGVMGWVGEPVGLLNQAYFTLIPVLALADAVHLVSRYHEERRRQEARAAVLAAARHAGLACTLTTATTMAAFLSLGIGSPPMLARFGVFAAAGLFAAYVTVFVLVPAGLRVTHRLPDPAGRHRWLAATSRLATTRPWRVVAVAVAIAAVFGAAGLRVTVDNRLSGLLRADHPVREAGAVLDASLGGTHSLEIELEGDEGVFREPRVINAVATFEDWASGEPAVRAVVGPGRNLEAMARATGAILDAPESIETVYARLAGEFDVTRIVSGDRARARVSIRTAETGGRAFEDLARRVRDEAVVAFTPLGIRATVTGTSLVAYRGVNRIGTAIETSLLLQFGAIALMFALLFRSVRIAAIAIVPNALPVLAGYGLLGLLGLDLDPLAGTILALGVGIAVDDTIHVLARVRERTRAGDDLPTAIDTAVVTTGRAVAITTVVIAAGLALNLLSSFPPLELLGLLGGVLMMTALASDLVLLPAMLIAFGIQAQADHVKDVKA